MTSITKTINLKPKTIQRRRYTLTRLDNGQTLTFEKRVVKIGSLPENDFVINDPSVSRYHAEITAEDDGYFKLRDLDSKNHVFVQNLKIKEIYFKTKTRIRFGLIDVEFQLTEEVIEIHVSESNRFGDLISDPDQMREIFGFLMKVAPTDSTILIEGESGTGKELIARGIHQNSHRKEGRFQPVDCASITSTLAGAALFGHQKGAYTGASEAGEGYFRAANGGTVFLDELGELSLDIQSSLLRALENKEVIPLGSTTPIHIDCRIIAATNRDLQKEIQQGNFREDLYYRLNVIPIKMPPLRERREDIRLLLDHFLKQMNRPELYYTYQTIKKLEEYSWPGNVRELKNYVERAAALAQNNEISSDYIHHNKPLHKKEVSTSVACGNGQETATNGIPYKEAKDQILKQFDLSYWTTMMTITSGNVSEAGRLAHVDRKTVENHLNKLGVSRDDFTNNS